MTRMNPDVRAQWVNALRSGDYVQGVKRLCTRIDVDHYQFCCLGVLMELAANAGIVTPVDVSAGRVYRDPVAAGQASAYLSLSVVEWIGLEERNPMINGWRASDWNDDGRATFDQLADMIEEM